MKRSVSDGFMRAKFKNVASWEQAHRRTITIVAIMLTLAIFSAICWHNAGRWSMWFDESFGGFMMRFNIVDIVRYTGADVHPPLYYLLLKGWVTLFGGSVVAVRAMSILFGAAAIVVGYLLARRLAGPRAGYLSLPLLALSPMLLRYGFEGRMYTLMLLLALLATYAFLVACQSKTKKSWTIYAVLIALGLWTHYFFALVFVAHWLWWVVQQFGTGARGHELIGKIMSKEWRRVNLIVFLSYLPWIPVVVGQFSSVQGGFWIAPISADTMPNYLTKSLFYLNHGEVKSWLAMLLIAIAVLFLVMMVKAFRTTKKPSRAELGPLLSVAATPVMLLMLMSLPPLQPSFIERYLVPSIVMLSILVAIVSSVKLRAIGAKVLQFTFLVMVMVAFSIGVINVVRLGNKTDLDTKALMQTISTKSSEQEIVIANNSMLFYSLAMHESDQNPVRILDENLEKNWGSTQMIRDQAWRIVGQHDLAPGTRVWYISISGATEPPRNDWTLTRELDIPGATAREYQVL